MTHQRENKLMPSNFDVVSSCSFIKIGDSTEDGGAIKVRGITYFRVIDSIFSECVAKSGGAIFCECSFLCAFSNCILSCRASLNSNNGGNAIFFGDCTLTIEHLTSHRCAPSTSECGDAVYMGDVESMLIGTNMNNSMCFGYIGECAFGVPSQKMSNVRYVNVADSEDYGCIWLSGIVEKSNFIRNTMSGLLINAPSNIKLRSCNFFELIGSTGTTGQVSYEDCYGNINLDGITSTEKILIHHFKIDGCDYRSTISGRCRSNSILKIGLYVLPSNGF